MIVCSVILYSVIAFASCQYQKPSKDAAILSEARYLAVNGQFGASYKQDDGVEFKEESDDEGNRRGSYSYIDPNGIRRTISYTAGKDGFKASGDHLPVAPAPVVPIAPVAPVVPSVGVGSDSGEYNPDNDYDDDTASKNYENQYNYQYNAEPSVFASEAQSQFNSMYKAAVQPPYKAAKFRFHQSPQYTADFSQYSTEGPPHHRLSQSGKLSVNRSPDGYSYTFNIV